MLYCKMIIYKYLFSEYNYFLIPVSAYPCFCIYILQFTPPSLTHLLFPTPPPPPRPPPPPPLFFSPPPKTFLINIFIFSPFLSSPLPLTSHPPPSPPPLT